LVNFSQREAAVAFLGIYGLFHGIRSEVYYIIFLGIYGLNPSSICLTHLMC
jgi:predicted Co/Zn/Cd cation transporter (cation efflux family)